MREIRTSGSEGGETGRTGLPYPYQDDAECQVLPAFAGTGSGRHPPSQPAMRAIIHQNARPF